MTEIHASITAERLLEVVETDGYDGFCTACGTDAEGIEPDAEGVRCAACGEFEVCGAEQLLIRIGG